MRVVRITGGSISPGRSLVESSELIADRSSPAPIQGAPFPALTLNVEMQALALGTFLKHLTTDTATVVMTTLVGTVGLGSGANINGLFLLVGVPGALVNTVAFAETNPIDASTIAAQINAEVGIDIATINGSDNLVLLPSTSGAPGYVRVIGGDSLTLLGLAQRTEWNYTRLKASAILPQGLSVEVGFTDIDLFTVMKGSKVNSWNIDMSPNGYVTGTLELLCRTGGEDYSAIEQDETPTESFSDKFDTFNGELLIDGVAEARLRSMSLSISNNMQEDYQTIYSAFRDALPEGKRTVSGSMGVQFDSTDFMDRAKNFVKTSIVLKMENTSSNNNRFIRIILPATRIQLPNFDIPEQAIDLPIDFIAHKDDGGEDTDFILEIGSGEAI
jgi:hypothetical protein